MKVKLPEAMTRFRCNEKGCCCQGWKIRFDPEDLPALLGVFSEDDRREVMRDVTITIDKNRVVQGLRLRTVGENQACQFLAAEGGCTVHAEYGIAPLPKLCRTYPAFAYDGPDGRIDMQFDAVCPEVLECLLESDAALELVEYEPEPEHHVAVRAAWVREPPPVRLGERTLTLEEFDAVRDQVVGALATDEPALDVLARINRGFVHLLDGAPVAAFEIPQGVDGVDSDFEQYFELAVSAHDPAVLARFLKHYRQFVFDIDLMGADPDEWTPYLVAPSDWRKAVDPR